MKKLLNLLSIAVLGITATIPKVIVDKIVDNISPQDNKKVQLNVKYIAAEKWYYCLPVSVQMIINYFQIDLTNYSQDEIYRALGGVDETGPDPYADIASYLNTAIPEGHLRRDYGNNWITYRFGRTQGEMALFQSYVYTSLYMGHPVLMQYNTDDNDAHAMIITGIITSSNPENTQYFVSDGNNPGENHWIFRGNEILTFFTYGIGRIVGYQAHPDFQRNDIVLAIDDWDVDKAYLSDYENHEVVKMHMDLTALTGTEKTGELSEEFKKITLNDFKGEIYKFSTRKTVNSFEVPLNNVPNDNDNWKSELIQIAGATEDVGSAHIEGRIMAQLTFSRSRLDHLILVLSIIVAGASWATSNYAHVWLQTGSILSFQYKHK